MTATKELRRLLDERGVEYKELVMGINGSDVVTYYDFGDLELAFDEFDNGHTLFRAWNMTPAQAVNATLGRGECHVTREPGSDRLWYCDACGSYHEHASEYPWENCPRCGAKVVSG